MNRSELIKVIREACVEAQPSILDLKFGCEVIYAGKKCKYLTHVDGFCDVMLPPVYDKGILQVTNPKLKILGRPITLTDILLAINQTQIKTATDHLIDLKSQDVKTFIWRETNDNIIRQFFMLWNLLLPLEDQETPLLEFIHDLIKQ